MVKEEKLMGICYIYLIFLGKLHEITTLVIVCHGYKYDPEALILGR